jgi:hypothetical protein
MTAAISQFTPSRRDSGLRRLRVANRVLAVAAIVLTLALAELAAHGFHGHARKLVVRSTPLRSTQPTGSTGVTGRPESERADGTPRVRHRHAVHKLRPPAQPPSGATTAASQPAPPAAPAAAQAAAAPSTTVSGGS